MKVEIWSDVVCPWCYIGKRKFDRAAARYTAETGDAVEVRYRPFLLDPSAPVVGRPVREVYEKKFGGPEAAQQILDRVTQAASEVGLHYRMDMAVRANTLAAHRLLVLADQEGCQDALKERLMAGYFTEGADIGQRDVLLQMAAESGLDREAAASWLDSGHGAEEVAESLTFAVDHEIASVPTYVLDGRLAVPGAQDPDTFVRLMTRVAASGC